MPSELDPPLYTEDAVNAIKAVAQGVANEGQQKLALVYITSVLSGVNDLSYAPDGLGGQRATDFREGRRYVGFHVRRIVETPLDVLMPPAAAKPKRGRVNP